MRYAYVQTCIIFRDYALIIDLLCLKWYNIDEICPSINKL